MATGIQSHLNHLKRLDRARTRGKWHITASSAGHFYINAVPLHLVGDIKRDDDAEFIIETANAFDWLVDLAQEALDRREADEKWTAALEQAGRVFVSDGQKWLVVWAEGMEEHGSTSQ